MSGLFDCLQLTSVASASDDSKLSVVTPVTGERETRDGRDVRHQHLDGRDRVSK